MAKGNGTGEWVNGRGAARWLCLFLFAQGCGCAAAAAQPGRRVRYRASICPNGQEVPDFEHVFHDFINSAWPATRVWTGPGHPDSGVGQVRLQAIRIQGTHDGFASDPASAINLDSQAEERRIRAAASRGTAVRINCPFVLISVQRNREAVLMEEPDYVVLRCADSEPLACIALKLLNSSYIRLPAFLARGAVVAVENPAVLQIGKPEDSRRDDGKQHNQDSFPHGLYPLSTVTWDQLLKVD